MENCQRLASQHARVSLEGGPDVFGEEETLSQLRNCLEAQGVEEERVAAQIARLARANTSLAPDPFGSISAGGLLLSQAADPPRTSENYLPAFPPLMDLAADDACEDPDAEQAEELAEDVNLDEVTQSLVPCNITFPNGDVKEITLKSRIDTAVEIEYLEHGGVLHYVLRNLAKAS